jgi:hypothetical protein
MSQSIVDSGNPQDKDFVAEILEQEKNRSKVIQLLQDSNNLFSSAQQNYEAAFLALDSKDSVQIGSIKTAMEYFSLCKEHLKQALTFAEEARDMKKISSEAEKEALPAIEVINRIRAKLFDVDNKISILENLWNSLDSQDWNSVLLYAENAQLLWSEKKDFFKALADLAKPRISKQTDGLFASLCKKWFKKP